MLHYSELSLPSQPIRQDLLQEIITEKLTTNNYQFVSHDIEKYIDPGLYEIFKKLGHIPEFLVCFGNTKQSAGVSYLHSDIIDAGDSWQSQTFAINWEITPGETWFKWWDPGNAEPIYPDRSRYCTWFHGLHYGSRGMTEHTTDFALVDKYLFKPGTPVLVQTDVPHSVSFNCTSGLRTCISLRFNTINSFAQAREVFEEFII